jgi:hypothetical protein
MLKDLYRHMFMIQVQRPRGLDALQGAKFSSASAMARYNATRPEQPVTP